MDAVFSKTTPFGPIRRKYSPELTNNGLLTGIWWTRIVLFVSFSYDKRYFSTLSVFSGEAAVFLERLNFLNYYFLYMFYDFSIKIYSENTQPSLINHCPVIRQSMGMHFLAYAFWHETILFPTFDMQNYWEIYRKHGKGYFWMFC